MFEGYSSSVLCEHESILRGLRQPPQRRVRLQSRGHPGGKDLHDQPLGQDQARTHSELHLLVSVQIKQTPSDITVSFCRYLEQDSMVDLMFPSYEGFDPDFKNMEYSSFGFWRDSIGEVDPEDVKQFVEASDKKSDKKKSKWNDTLNQIIWMNEWW